MIQSAGKKNLKQSVTSVLPDVSAALQTFFQPMAVGIVTKEVVKGYNEERVTYIATMGVKQPFTAEQLTVKPEGMRSWKWFLIHCEPDVDVATDDIIRLMDGDYRVMARNDFSEYGYMEYHVVKDYASEKIG